jgi:hypothetical protein
MLHTFQRWVREGGDGVAADRRPISARPVPANKLSEDECAEILTVVNSVEFASLPPGQIVPTLADRGVYVASESSFYRVLKAASQPHHRGRAKKPCERVVTSHCATVITDVAGRDCRIANSDGSSLPRHGGTVTDEIFRCARRLQRRRTCISLLMLNVRMLVQPVRIRPVDATR